MTDPAPEVEAVAAKLSEAQRKFILKCGDPKRPFKGMWRTGLTIEEEFALKQQGLVRWDSAPLGTMAPICRLIELGRRVRAHLQDHPNVG